MIQIGFVLILIILILGIIVIGPKRLPDVVKAFLRLYKKIENKLSSFKKDIEEDIGADELRKDVFNELRMEELEKTRKSNDD